MWNKIKRFFILSVCFSVGIFIGEWLFDYLTNEVRRELFYEIREAMFIGVFVSVLFVLFQKK